MMDLARSWCRDEEELGAVLELWKVEVAAEEAQSPGLLDVLVRSVRSPLP